MVNEPFPSLRERIADELRGASASEGGPDEREMRERIADKLRGASAPDDGPDDGEIKVLKDWLESEINKNNELTDSPTAASLPEGVFVGGTPVPTAAPAKFTPDEVPTSPPQRRPRWMSS